jgi:hypothetical protein
MMVSACGVLCTDCPAYQANATGPAHQARTADAWRRIYGLSVAAADLTCGGCLGPDEDLFHQSRTCVAGRCCRTNRFSTCAECPKESCPDLEQAQALWDEVPRLAATLCAGDFATYAQPYCGHRERLAGIRVARRRRS